MSANAHWQANLRLTRVLLGVWLAVSFVLPYFARDLSFSFFGWPFGFWVAAQGALVVYVLIVWLYSRRMRRLDEVHGVADSPYRHPS